MKLFFQQTVSVVFTKYLRQMILGVMTCIICMAYGHDFSQDGIYYTITSLSPAEVSVASHPSIAYEGDMTIPASVEYGDRTFFVTGTEDYAFAWSKALTSVKFPNTVATISSYAFYQCEALLNVQLPNSLKAIDEYAFNMCDNLQSIELPNSLEKLGFSAFSQCSNLKSVTIGENISECGLFVFSQCGIETADVRLKEIPNELFSNLPSLREIKLSNKLTSIGNFAFWNCTGLKELNLPPALERIGDYAFSGCSNLKEINLPESIVAIGPWAFNECTALENVALPSKLNIIENGTFCGCTMLERVTMNDGTTVIGERAFENCSRLKNIVLPSNLTAIESSGFNGCEMLESIDIHNGITTIGPCAFMNCTRLEKIILGESLVSIESGSFSNCPLTDVYFNCINFPLAQSLSNVKNFHIGSNITVIPANAFEHFTSMVSLDLPDTLEEIKAQAFYNCENLKTLDIPNSVRAVGNYAFGECRSLEELTLGEGLIECGSSVFTFAEKLKKAVVNCLNVPEDILSKETLETLILGSKVKTIGDYAFYSVNLKSVICHAKSVPEIEYFSFSYHPEGRTAYVPEESLEAYRNSDWKKYFSNFLPLEASVKAIGEDEIGKLRVFDINGREILQNGDTEDINKLGKGLYIVNGKTLMVL